MLAQGTLHLVRVAPEVPGHGQCHERGIKYVHAPLDAQQVAVVAHGVLDDAEDVPDHDTGRCGVEHVEGLLPRHIDGAVAGVPIAAEAPMKDHGGNDEDGKDDDLQNETTDDNVGAHVGINIGVARACLNAQAGATGLDDEAEDVARDEDAGEPSWADGCVFLTTDGENYAAECHVECGCYKNGAEQEESRLHDVGHERAGAVVGQNSANVSRNLNCSRICIRSI